MELTSHLFSATVIGLSQPGGELHSLKKIKQLSRPVVKVVSVSRPKATPAGPKPNAARPKTVPVSALTAGRLTFAQIATQKAAKPGSTATPAALSVEAKKTDERTRKHKNLSMPKVK